MPLLVGFVDRNEGRGKPFHNAAALLETGKPMRKTHKSLLPTYDVFDEDRYFEPASRVEAFDLGGRKIGVTICEDIWTDIICPILFTMWSPSEGLIDQGAEIILNLSASPFTFTKPAIRHEMVASLARTYQRPICYCNAVGGNDQLVFDGNSIAANAGGNLIAQLDGFREQEAVIDTDNPPPFSFAKARRRKFFLPRFRLASAIIFANAGFHSAVLGLSGGIDSAVIAVIAVEALGAENVTGVAMPSPILPGQCR